MKITVLDGGSLNPGDLSWDELNQFGQVTIYNNTEEKDIINHIADSNAILLNKVNITESILDACPSLCYIGVQATGYNVIDLQACKKHKITVTNVPSYSTGAVAQFVFAFISEFACRTKEHSDSVFAGEWVNSKNFSYTKAPLMELEGKTLGILGYGNIGRKVAQIANAYGMKVIVCTRTPQADILYPVDFETLLKESDILTLHVPLTDKTKGIINSNTLKLMKSSAYIINTARGAIINEYDMLDALKNNIIAGYAADVVSEEPMVKDNSLLLAPKDKILLTPHIAWAARETRQRLLDIVIENLKCFIEGKPQNVISD